MKSCCLKYTINTCLKNIRIITSAKPHVANGNRCVSIIVDNVELVLCEWTIIVPGLRTALVPRTINPSIYFAHTHGYHIILHKKKFKFYINRSDVCIIVIEPYISILMNPKKERFGIITVCFMFIGL